MRRNRAASTLCHTTSAQRNCVYVATYPLAAVRDHRSAFDLVAVAVESGYGGPRKTIPDTRRRGFDLPRRSVDAEAFATLYDRHSRAAFSLAYRMMGERQAAEDLAQDAFLKVWRGAGSYRAERGSVRTWILSIVHNRGIDQLRSHASRRRTQDKIEASAPRSQPSEAFAETWRNSQRDQVREALNTLPAEQLKILELAYFSGYTHVEISQVTQPAVGNGQG